MGGRSFQKVTSGNGQASWIAYVGVQFLLGSEQEIISIDAPSA
jgi:hypothetical protein